MKLQMHTCKITMECSFSSGGFGVVQSVHLLDDDRLDVMTRIRFVIRVDSCDMIW